VTAVPPFRVAVQLKSVPLPFAKALPWLREAGAKAIEIDARGELRPQNLSDTGVRQIRKLLDDCELKVAAIEFHTSRGYGTTDDLDRRVEATKAAMKMARQFGCDLVVNQVGRVPEDLNSPEGQTLVEVLHDLGLHAQRAGAWLAAETGSESGADLKRLIDALPPGALFATLDPGNLLVNGFSPHDAATALGNSIRHVYARDAVRDFGRGKASEVQLGRGAIDWQELIGLLEALGYRGYLSIKREHWDDPLVEIKQALSYLANI
jgi:sugar phosphate isomerase/epimerase